MPSSSVRSAVHTRPAQGILHGVRIGNLAVLHRHHDDVVALDPVGEHLRAEVAIAEDARLAWRW